MMLVKASIVFNNGDALESVLCKVDYEKKVIFTYSDSFDKNGFIPLSSIMKFEFKGYHDSEKGEIDSSDMQADEGW